MPQLWYAGRGRSRLGAGPRVRGGFSGEEAVVAMQAVGVDRIVNVPAVVAGDDNSYANEVAQKYPGKFGIMGRINLGAPDAADQLKTWRDQPHMSGIRLSGGVPSFRELLDAKQLEWLWSGCEEHHIPLMVLLGGQQEPIFEVAEQHPGLTLILDHLGLRLAEDGTAWETLDKTLALAKFPNVHVKVSSVPNFSTQPFPYRDTSEPIRRVYDAYGPRRMFWGSDFTRLWHVRRLPAAVAKPSSHGGYAEASENGSGVNLLSRCV